MVVKTLGDITKKYRKENKISLRAFAKMCGLSKSYLSILEQNMNPTNHKEPVPSLDVITSVAKVMDVSPISLMEQIGMQVTGPESKPSIPQEDLLPGSKTKIKPFEHIPPTVDNINAALKERRILILPFRVPREGEMVYALSVDFGPVAHTVTKVQGGVYMAESELMGKMTFNLFDIGHTVFMTRKEAGEAIRAKASASTPTVNG